MPNPIFALIVTLLIQVLASLALMTAPVIAPEAAPTMALQATKVGIFIALAYVTAMTSSLVSGYLIERYGAMRISQISLLLCASGLALATVAHPAALVGGALLIGSGYGPITPASSHILARTTPAQVRSMYFSIKQTGVPLGGAVAGLLIPFIVIFWPWRSAVLTIMALCVLGALACQPLLTQFDQGKNPARRLNLYGLISPFRAVMRAPNIRRLALCTLFFSIAQLCLNSYIVTYLTTDLGMALTTAGLIMFIIQGSGVIGRIVWGIVADHWLAPMRLLALLGVGMAVCSLLMAVISPDWSIGVIILICAAFGATAIGWNGVYLAEVARLAPAGQAGLMTGGTLFFTYLGVVIGPPIFTFIVESSQSFALGYALLGGLIALVTLFMVRQLANKS